MAREGYYPDPSIPGYVRYWNGLSWVPGTSRPAAAVPAARSEETGPVFLDEPVAEPVVWQADPVHQAGFGGPRDRRVSWGSPEPRPGISLARPPAAEPLREDPELPPHRAREGAGPSPRGREGAGPSPQPPGFDLGGPVDAAASAQGPGFDAAAPGEAELRLGRGREGAGEFPQGAEHDHALPSDPWKRSAPEETPRRPHGPGATPAAPPAEVPPAPAWPGAAWPEAAGASMSGMTSSWPEAEPRREPAPPRADEPWPPRATGGRPVLPRPAEAAPSGPPRTDDAGPEAWSPRPAGTRPVLPRPAETTPSRADDAGPEAWSPRPAGTRPVPPRPAETTPSRADDAGPEAWSPRPAGTRPVPPRPAETTPSRADDAGPEAWPPRPAGTRPVPPRPAEAAASGPSPRTDEAWPPRVTGTRPVLPRPADDSAPPREETARAVFERMAEHAVRPAGLGRRFTARALDSLVYAGAAYAAARPLLPGATAHVQAKVDAARAGGRPTTVWLLDATITGQLALVLGAVLLFGIVYEVLPTARWGRTPGKGLLGVRVLATATLRPPRFGAALRRWLVYAFLGLPGSLACLANRPRRQAWHDKAAKTYVSR